MNVVEETIRKVIELLNTSSYKLTELHLQDDLIDVSTYSLLVGFIYDEDWLEFEETITKSYIANFELFLKKLEV